MAIQMAETDTDHLDIDRIVFELNCVKTNIERVLDSIIKYDAGDMEKAMKIVEYLDKSIRSLQTIERKNSKNTLVKFTTII